MLYSNSLLWQSVALQLIVTVKYDMIMTNHEWNNFILLFQPDSPRQRPHNLHETYQLPHVQLVTPDDGHSRCPKHVEFRDKIKFWILDASCWLFVRRLELFLALGQKSERKRLVGPEMRICSPWSRVLRQLFLLASTDWALPLLIDLRMRKAYISETKHFNFRFKSGQWTKSKKINPKVMYHGLSSI
jgi:hypothetical protein